MPRQEVSVIMEDLKQESYQELERPACTKGCGREAVVWRVWPGAFHSGKTAGGPHIKDRVYNPDKKTYTVHVRLGALVDAVEGMAVPPGGGGLGEQGQQALPSRYDQLDQHPAARDAVRVALAKAKPGGAPMHARVLDGFQVETAAHRFVMFPSVFDPDAVRADKHVAPAAAAAPLAAPSEAPRPKARFTGYDLHSGNRAQRLGIADAMRETQVTLEQIASDCPLHDDRYIDIWSTKAALDNSVLHLRTVMPRAPARDAPCDWEAMTRSLELRPCFPHPAACVEPLPRRGRPAAAAAPARQFDTYPQNLVDKTCVVAPRSGGDHHDIIGEGVNCATWERARPKRSLGSPGMWTRARE
jgi:hypothetical protein